MHLSKLLSIRFFVAISLAAGYSGGVSAETVVSERDYALPKCDKPTVSLTVGNLTCKSAACQPQNTGGRSSNGLILMLQAQGKLPPSLEGVGDGMRDMLTTILKSTGCFDIQERQAMDEIQKELEAAGQKAVIKPADYIISGSISSIGMETSNKRYAVVNKTKQHAYVNLDMRVIDVKQTKVLDSRTFEADSERSSHNVFVSTPIGGFGGSQSGLRGTALEDVTRDALVRVAVFATEKLAASSITTRTNLAKQGETKSE